MADNACSSRRPFWSFLSCLGVVVVGLLLSFSSTVRAQGQLLGVLHGTIKDQQGGVLPGVTVTATPTDSRPPSVTLTDASGFYTLKDLPPGEYAVKAELAGFATLVQLGIRARAGLTISVDLQMPVGAVDEVVTVRRDSPLLEVSAATTAVNISGELQRALPLSYRRDWADFLLVTPGVISTSGASSTNYFLHGASNNSQVLQIDGADVAAAAFNSTFFVQLSSEAINDVQIKTAALDASSPLGLGGVVNLATQSGSNRVTGAAAVSFQPHNWNGSNTPGGTSTTVKLFQLDVAAGGPLRRDRLWYFGSYRRTQRTEGLSRTSEQLDALQSLEPAFRPFDNETNANYYFLKLTSQLSQRHQLFGFAQYDKTPQGINQGTYAGPFARQDVGGHAQTLRLSSVIGGSTTTQLAVSYNNKGSSIVAAATDRASRNVYDSVSLVSGALVGGGLRAVLDNFPSSGSTETADKLTLSADATFIRRGWFGAHEFQAGVYLQPILNRRTREVWPSEGFALEEVVLTNPRDPAAGIIPFHRRIYDGTTNPLAYVDSSDHAVYLQDVWRPTSRLTFNAGMRVDFVRQTDRVFDTRTQDSTEIGPRFGMNYVLTQSGRDTLRASWTRVHDVASNTALSVGSSTLGYRDIYDVDLDGTFESTFITPGATAVNPRLVVNPSDYHQPYVNEITAGYRRQLPGQVIADVGWVRREFRDRTAGVEMNGIYDGEVFRGYRNESVNEIHSVTNNVWNWPVYSALELQVASRTARLQAIGSYTRQWRHLDGTWQPNDPASFIQPNAFPNNRGIGGTRAFLSLDTNSLSGSQAAATSLSEWHDHALRGGLAYLAPFNVTLATSYVFQSGAWSGPVVARIDQPDSRFGPTTLRLSNGRIVQNPLATTIRFVGPTRGDGQIRLPNLHIWNLRIGRRFPVQRQQLEVMVDLFNIANGDADQWFLSGGNQLYSQNYGRGRNRQLPRSGQVAVRLVF